MSRYFFKSTANIGYEVETQEDFIQYTELDDDTLFCVIADGAGSRREFPDAASVAVMDIVGEIERIFAKSRETFLENPLLFIESAMLRANKILLGMKLGSEQHFSGYASCVTCLLLFRDRHFCIAHSGNSRVYLLRNGRLSQLTRDHTEAMDLFDQGKITEDLYHIHPSRLILTSALGVLSEPTIQMKTGKFRENDVFLMTTDGIHYAVRKEAMAQLILNSTREDAAETLINASKDEIKYPDNMTAAIICENKEELS